MFSYYGCKSKLLTKYSQPKYNLIIEPFAGSARYACRYGIDRDVWINDLYKPIYRIWKWLIQATPNDVMSLPELEKGDDLRDFKQLSDVEREFLGFCVGQCRNSPGNVLTGWAARDNEIVRTKSRMAPILGKISHWKVTCRSFSNILTTSQATYFIDPPYQNRKCDYVVGFDRYSELATYCRKRNGQVIVCEALPADWLDFVPLYSQMGQRRVSKEMVWEKTDQ